MKRSCAVESQGIGWQRHTRVRSPQLRVSGPVSDASRVVREYVVECPSVVADEVCLLGQKLLVVFTKYRITDLLRICTRLARFAPRGVATYKVYSEVEDLACRYSPTFFVTHRFLYYRSWHSAPSLTKSVVSTWSLKPSDLESSYLPPSVFPRP
jgi:hypothetical protein